MFVNGTGVFLVQKIFKKEKDTITENSAEEFSNANVFFSVLLAIIVLLSLVGLVGYIIYDILFCSIL